MRTREAVTRLTERVLNRAARELVNHGVPPRLTGYRHLRTAAPSEFAYQELEGADVSHVPLPCNVSSRDELSKERRLWGFSFYDVPDRPVRETWIATVPDCRIITAHDQWREPYYAILHDGRQLDVRGTGYNRAIHGHVDLAASNVVRLPRASWILEQWDRNYSHWLLWHMVKLALLQRLRPDQPVILPSGSRLAPVISRSVEMLHIRNAIELPAAVCDAGELTVVGIDLFRPSRLSELRAALPLTFDHDPSLRVFISRQRSQWRRLQNEEQVWEVFRANGFERVVMEDLTFDEQMHLMSNAGIVAGVHGAGLANILFAPAGIDVIEVSPADFPDPHFYALAGALEQRYWLLRGSPAGVRAAAYDDVVVDVVGVRDVLDRIEKRRARPRA